MWIAVLLAIGVVQIVRAQWFDAAVFLAIPLLLLVLRPRGAAPGSTSRIRIAAALLAGIGFAAALTPRHTMLMQTLVIGAGALVLLTAWPQAGSSADDRGSGSPIERRLALCWGVILVIGCLWELGQFIAGLLHPAQPSYALSDLIDPLLNEWPGRAAFVVAWIAAGLFLLKRSPR